MRYGFIIIIPKLQHIIPYHITVDIIPVFEEEEILELFRSNTLTFWRKISKPVICDLQSMTGYRQGSDLSTGPRAFIAHPSLIVHQCTLDGPTGLYRVASP